MHNFSILPPCTGGRLVRFTRFVSKCTQITLPDTRFLFFYPIYTDLASAVPPVAELIHTKSGTGESRVFQPRQIPSLRRRRVLMWRNVLCVRSCARVILRYGEGGGSCARRPLQRVFESSTFQHRVLRNTGGFFFTRMNQAIRCGRKMELPPFLKHSRCFSRFRPWYRTIPTTVFVGGGQGGGATTLCHHGVM